MRPLLLALTALVLSVVAARGQPDSGDARLREALRATTLQLRTAQADLAAAQAAQTALADEKKALADQLAALRKQAGADKLAAEKTSADLSGRVAAQAKRIKELETALSATTGELRERSDALRETQATLKETDAERLALRSKVEDREARNLALYLLANEILGRYEDYSLGKALLAKEPFVGKTRTKLENLVQDYEDELLEQRVGAE